jgi:cysteinyl-tRNA synthetase
VPSSERAALLLDWDQVLGLGLQAAADDSAAATEAELPSGAAELLEARGAARQRRDWAESDRLRDELDALGVELSDTREGTTWRLRPN